MNYAYVRVSSISQNIGRQLEEIKKYNVEEKNVYIDKESGKDFLFLLFVKKNHYVP